MRGGAENGGAGAEAALHQCGLRRAGEFIAAAPGRLQPQRRDQRRLVALRVFAGAFAELRVSALRVENIIGDLKGRAQRAAVIIERGALGGVGAPQRGAGQDRKAQQRAGLHRLEALGLVFAQRRLGRLRLQIKRLPADHAADARGAGEAEHKLGADGGIGMGRGIGEDVEGQRQQRVAREDRRRLVIGAVQARPAAPYIVIVHAREIIMDKRVAVQQFHRRPRPQRALAIDAKKRGGLDQQKRPQSFARAQRRIAHRLQQASGAQDFAGQAVRSEQAFEHPLDLRPDGLEPRGKFRAGGRVSHNSVRSGAAKVQTPTSSSRVRLKNAYETRLPEQGGRVKDLRAATWETIDRTAVNQRLKGGTKPVRIAVWGLFTPCSHQILRRSPSAVHRARESMRLSSKNPVRNVKAASHFGTSARGCTSRLATADFSV